MANKQNKEIKEIPETSINNVDVELQKQLEEKDKELNELKNTLNDMTDKFNSFEQMIKDLQKNNTPIVNTEKILYKANDETVKIGSCLVGRHFLCDSNGSEIIEFDNIGDIQSISTRLLDGIMTAKNKQLFKDGLVYFIDDAWYERYSIKKSFVLDEKSIDTLYSLPVNEMVKEINKLTNDGKNEKVKYSLYWTIVKNISEGKSGYNDKNKEITIGNLFNVDINNSIGQMAYAKEVNFF